MLEDFGNIKKDFLEYIQVQFDLIRLQTAENISRIFSKAANLVIIGYLVLFVLLFLSFSAGFYISSLLNSDELGFLCVAGFYFLLLLIFLLLRKQIVDRPIIKAILKVFFPKS
jgi:hypothetical protein